MGSDVSSENVLAKGYLTVITYNVWFANVEFDNRAFKHIEMFHSYDADIIVLQEVTERYVGIIMRNEKIRANYSISHTVETFFDSYGVYLLFKKGLNLTSLTLYDLPTKMERNCLVSEYLIDNVPLCCAVSHLESLDSAELRELQLKQIADNLKELPNCLVMGDFNFDSEIDYSQHIVISELTGSERTEERNKICQANLQRNTREGGKVIENESLVKHFIDYIDVWPQLREDKGYTFDSESNLMLADSYEQMRYDRILFKSQTSTWKPLSIELIGNELIKEISTEDNPIYPSDHFGLMVKIGLQR